MTAPTKALREFLKANWKDRYLFGTQSGTFNPKVVPNIGIDTFTGLMTFLKEAIAADDWDKADEILAFLPLYEGFLAGPRYKGHAPHLTNLVNAIAKRNAVKARLHLDRLTAVVHLVANDRVFKDNERVSVIRHEHGWVDGRVSGTVKPGSGGYVVEGDDGMEYDIKHLRDIR